MSLLKNKKFSSAYVSFGLLSPVPENTPIQRTVIFEEFEESQEEIHNCCDDCEECICQCKCRCVIL